MKKEVIIVRANDATVAKLYELVKHINDTRVWIMSVWCFLMTRMIKALLKAFLQKEDLSLE